VQPSKGSSGGSIVVAKVIGVGKSDSGISVTDSKGATLCTKVEVFKFNHVRCTVKEGAFTSGTAKVIVNSKTYTCGATTTDVSKCAYEQTATAFPAVTAVTKSATKTITVAGTDFFTKLYTASLTYGDVKADSVTISSATSLIATFSKGVPIVKESTIPCV